MGNIASAFPLKPKKICRVKNNNVFAVGLMYDVGS